MAFSLVVFAGSAQFVAVGLVAAGTAVPLIILTTFIVNLRHMLYSATLVPYVSPLNAGWKVAIAFFLTDEAFAASIDRYQQPDASPYKHWHYLSAAVIMYLNWALFTFLGLTLGRLIPNAAAWGLDFAMVATFIGMVVPYIKQCPSYVERPLKSVWRSPMVATVVVSCFVAALAYPLPHQLGIIAAALAGVAAGVASDRWRSGPPYSVGGQAMSEWLLVSGMAAVTFAIRYSLIGVSERVKLPPVVVSALRFVPPAVLSAIVVPAVLFPEGRLSVGLGNARLVGAVATVLFAFWKNSLLFTIGAGMGFFLGYQVLIASLL